jgi:hypothetical protein
MRANKRALFLLVLVTAAVVVALYGVSNAQQYSPSGGNTFGGLTAVDATAPLVLTVSGTTVVGSILASTDSVPGSMSAADKTKLDGITAGSNTVNGLTSLTGSVTASGPGASAATVVQVDGTGTATIVDGGTAANIVATQTAFASGNKNAVYSARQRVQTTDGTTAVICCQYTPTNDEVDRWNVTITARDAQGDGGSEKYGSFGTGDMSFVSNRFGSGAPTLSPSTPVQINIGGAGFSDGAVWNMTLAAVVSTSTVLIEVTGVRGYNPITVDCSCEAQTGQ